MIIITLQREDCIGCNYCAELAPSYFGMDEEDGKSELFDSIEKKGFYTHKTHDPDALEECGLAAESCPVGIIKTKSM
jgi:ferredoxin